MFSYKYSTYQIIKDPCNGKQCQNNISSYGEITHHTKHDASLFMKKNIFKYILIISFMKQFTFLQEGSNRILSKAQKSFWSCSHMNCCLQKYIIHQFTNFIHYFFKTISKIQKRCKSNKYIKRYMQNNFYYCI